MHVGLLQDFTFDF